jgi:hypothetical protein
MIFVAIVGGALIALVIAGLVIREHRRDVALREELDRERLQARYRE